MLFKYGWNEQAVIYNKQIKFYYEKLEKDKKLREIEAQKVQKQKEYKELHKTNEIDTIRAVILSLNKEEEILDLIVFVFLTSNLPETLNATLNHCPSCGNKYILRFKYNSLINPDLGYIDGDELIRALIMNKIEEIKAEKGG